MRTTTFSVFDYLPASVREFPKRRAAEIARDRRAGRGRLPRGRAAHLVGRRSEPQPRHQRAGPQSPRRPRRDRRGHRDADAGSRLHRRARPARLLGVAAAHRAAAPQSGPQGGLLSGRARGDGRGGLAPSRAGKLAASHRARRRGRRRAARGAAASGVSVGLGRVGLRRVLRGDRHPRADGGLRGRLRQSAAGRRRSEPGAIRRPRRGPLRRRGRRGRAGLRNRVHRRRHPRPPDREGRGPAAHSPAAQGRSGAARLRPARLRPIPRRLGRAPGRRRRPDQSRRLRAARQAGAAPSPDRRRPTSGPPRRRPGRPPEARPPRRGGRPAQVRLLAARRMDHAAAAGAGRAEEVGGQDLQRRARAERPDAGGRARRLRRQGRDHERPSRPGRHPLRTRAGPGREVVARHRPRRRHRPVDVGGLRARRGRPGPQRDRHRTAEPAARDGLSARTPRQRGLREVEASTGDRARQDDRRRAGHRRPRPHAAPAGRRHHRVRQVGRDQHHDPVAASTG